MADHFWGEIRIGGELAEEHVQRFCNTMGVDEAIVRLCSGKRLFHSHSEACGGEFEKLEGLCQELQLPYRRESDGKYEISPELTFWVPGMREPATILLDHSGNQQVKMDVVFTIRDLLRAKAYHAAREVAEDAVVDVPEIPPFRCIGGHQPDTEETR